MIARLSGLEDGGSRGRPTRLSTRSGTWLTSSPPSGSRERCLVGGRSTHCQEQVPENAITGWHCLWHCEQAGTLAKGHDASMKWKGGGEFVALCSQRWRREGINRLCTSVNFLRKQYPTSERNTRAPLSPVP